MSKMTWVITGATSAISKAFAKLIAPQSEALILVGRNEIELHRQAKDINIRYAVHCEILVQDFEQPITPLLEMINEYKTPLGLFLAHSHMHDNDHLNLLEIQKLVTVNLLKTCQIVHTYLHKPQNKHQLIFLSSVAAARGRGKNSLYGASKAAMEVYLQGLQQTANPNTTLTIARLGYIDTLQTYGKPGIFYAASPENTAKACLRALTRKKRLFYYPFFWRWIMAMICTMPWGIFKKLNI